MGEALKNDIPVLLYKGYRVKQAKEKDAEHYSFYRNILSKETDGFGATVDEELFLEILESVTKDPGKEFWLVWKDDEIVGELSVSNLSENEESYISLIAVLKKHSGKGIATVLLEAVAELSKKRKCKNITLAVEKDTPDLVKWYTKRGYSQTFRNEEMYHMFKPLREDMKFKWFRERVL